MTDALSQKLAHLKAGMAQGRNLDDDRLMNLFEDITALLYDLDMRVRNLEAVKPPRYADPRGT